MVMSFAASSPMAGPDAEQAQRGITGFRRCALVLCLSEQVPSGPAAIRCIRMQGWCRAPVPLL